jgi:hypothetical protein
MRYFLDTEYNGMGGQLLSIGLVPEHGDQEFYAVLEADGADPRMGGAARDALSALGAARAGRDADVACGGGA